MGPIVYSGAPIRIMNRLLVRTRKIIEWNYLDKIDFMHGLLLADHALEYILPKQINTWLVKKFKTVAYGRCYAQ
jgi:hypothetical protein